MVEDWSDYVKKEDEIDYNYLILQKATEGVSEKMSLSYHKNRLCINKVPTKISANGIRMAFTGLSEFLGKEKAAGITSNLLRKKLKKLF
jgi:hypothetical protein